MTVNPSSKRWLRTASLAVIGITALALGGRVYASDHQDTPEVELNPRMDINDVYAFPGASADRIALVFDNVEPHCRAERVVRSKPVVSTEIDNTGDAVEDLVFQVTFDDGVGAAQKYTVRGPVAPTMTGTNIDHASVSAALPGGVELAYDGLVVEVCA